jgi:putative membrane protein
MVTMRRGANVNTLGVKRLHRICIQGAKGAIKMMTRILVGSFLMCGVLAAGAQTTPSTGTDNSSASASTASHLSAPDRTFIKKAAEGGMAEVELGKLAADKGTTDDVKKFGQRMVDDHTKANDQLKQIASSKGVAVPDDLNAKDKALKARLEKLSGAQFDRAYMKDMVKDHVEDVADFSKESKMAKDPDVKSFASQTLPTLKDHLKNARSVASQTGSATNSKGEGSGSGGAATK